VLFWTRPNCWE